MDRWEAKVTKWFIESYEDKPTKVKRLFQFKDWINKSCTLFISFNKKLFMGLPWED